MEEDKEPLWCIMENLDKTIMQVLPLSEQLMHELDGECRCKPTSEIGENGTIIITHNAFFKTEN